MKASGKDKLIWLPVLTLGFTSSTAQILFMRELMVPFYGNELAMGLILGIWLFWNAFGSRAGKWIVRQKTGQITPMMQICLSAALPAVLILIRASRRILPFTIGEQLGILETICISLAVLAPCCILTGLLYTILCVFFSSRFRKTESIGLVYFLEAAGAGFGGICISLILIRFLLPLQMVLLLSSMNLVSALTLSVIGRLRATRIFCWITLTLSIPFWIYSPSLQKTLDRLLWGGHRLCKIVNSPYGNLALTQSEKQLNVYENGIHMFSIPDPLTAEESIHFSMLEHPHPQNVLLIGGGMNGALREIMRHASICKIVYVELDPNLIRIVNLPEDSILLDPRISIHYMDGRQYIKRTGTRYDVVIINLPNPYTAQLNRYYTLDFFREIRRILTPGGVLSLQFKASENVIPPELGLFLGTMHSTLSGVFSNIAVLPGGTVRMMASDSSWITADADTLIGRIRDRNLQTIYIQPYFLKYQLSKERREYLSSQIVPVPSSKWNRDLYPVGYYIDSILWATAFSKESIVLFRFFQKIGPWTIVIFMIIASVCALLFRRRKNQGFSLALFVTLLCVGFTEIALEVILILLFQTVYGYAYQQLALLIASYMAGLALGSGLLRIRFLNISDPSKAVLWLQGIMTVFLLFLMANLPLAQKGIPSLSWLFPVAALVAGWIGGTQFPLVNRIMLRRRSVSDTAGMLYSADLIGAAAGAVLISLFILPNHGIPKTLGFLAWINLIAWALLLISRNRINR